MREAVFEVTELTLNIYLCNILIINLYNFDSTSIVLEKQLINL